MPIYDKWLCGLWYQTFWKTIVFIFASGLPGELPFMPLLCLPAQGAAVIGKLSGWVAVPKTVSSFPWCAWSYIVGFSRVIWKQLPPVFLQDCYFHIFISRERENIQSLFKCYCLSIRSRSNSKGETKIPVCIYAIFATLCAFWASIQNKQIFKSQNLNHTLQKKAFIFLSCSEIAPSQCKVNELLPPVNKPARCLSNKQLPWFKIWPSFLDTERSPMQPLKS